jgi:alpha-glucosidase
MLMVCLSGIQTFVRSFVNRGEHPFHLHSQKSRCDFMIWRMYFGRISHPDNFTFCDRYEADQGLAIGGSRVFAASAESIGADVFHLRAAFDATWENPSQAVLAENFEGADSCAMSIDECAAFKIAGKADEAVYLSGNSGASFGVSGKAWLVQFSYSKDMEFYGLGEHCRGFEKTGQRVKFWNTDVWADYPLSEAFEGNPASLYIAIPWLVVKRGNNYVGILVNHPGAVFMDMASNFIWDVKNHDDIDRGTFYIGAPDGNADIYIIVGPSLAKLMRKMQTLVGKTPLPPLWALGYQQCRWGYAGPADLHALDGKFTKYGIPADGLWLDIDYMDRYRIFTFNPELWGDREETEKTLAQLRAHGRRIVPIIDPGVKAERGYAVCDDGLAKDVFCHNSEGTPYTGFVWPGKTYMPDFSLPEVRKWWADNVKNFAGTGISGAWLDMNDPSVGCVENSDMLFDRGASPHESYHNQYALGMAEASRNGFLAASPDARPFLLSRSAFISSSRHTAVWTGDNYANRHYLKLSIPMTLNLAMSGIPFNGPDVPGFGGDATPELAVAWYKSGFLFPFFRNHSICDAKSKEPWAFGEAACEIIAHYIRLRYKLLPYIYQLWIAQEKSGEAVMRPLFYDFADTKDLPLGKIDDEFMIGPSVMQAPILDDGATSRIVTLPEIGEKKAWFSAIDGRWLEGGRTIKVAADDFSTPLYIREGAVIPMRADGCKTPASDLRNIGLHIFLRRGTNGSFLYLYECDDGESYAYTRGERTSVRFNVTAKNGSLAVAMTPIASGYGDISVSLFLYDDFGDVTMLCDGVAVLLVSEDAAWRISGAKVKCRKYSAKTTSQGNFKTTFCV